MKKAKLLLPLLLLLNPSIVSCGEQKISFSIQYDTNNEIVSFGVDNLVSSLEDNGFVKKDSDTDYSFVIETNESSKSESYNVTVKNKRIKVCGADDNGTLYGILDLKDKILMNSIEAVTSFENAPDIEKRGVKFDLPLDMRTPSYGDQADSAQANMEHIWDLEFWKEELDALALDKYNALTVWSLNPFPSMCKVPEYPDIALDDVWRTKIPFDDTYNGTATNFVRDEHWLEGNYEVIKKITMDEKIAHWKSVMEYAHSRGIEFYIMTWNIYTYGEHGKYGITTDVNNDTTRDYYRKSVKAMFDTYPDLDGIGCTAGENMEWASDTDTANEQWLYDTFGEGINDYLKTNPNRNVRLLHRLHFAEFNIIEDIWKDFKGTLDYSDNYSKAHMFSSRKPTYTNEIFSLLPSSKRIFLELRSDDFYIHRYGNPNFVRDYLQNMPGSEKVRGVWIGGDGYCRGKDYSSNDDAFKGQLHYKKDWYNNAIMGRLAYDKALDNDYFIKLLGLHYSSVSDDKIQALFNSMINAGEILPETTMQYFLNGDAAWYPEGGFGHSTMNGFISIKKLINCNNVMQDSGRVGIADYCKALENNQLDQYKDYITPDKVAQRIREFASNANTYADQALNGFKPNSFEEKEFVEACIDQKEFASLGNYYAYKFDATIQLRLYNDKKEKAYQEEAAKLMQKAVEAYQAYATSYSSRYIDLRLGRAGDFHIHDVLKLVEDDISIINKWTPRNYN